MFQLKKQLILATAILSVSSVSISKEFSYDYVQGSYASSSIDTLSMIDMRIL